MKLNQLGRQKGITPGSSKACKDETSNNSSGSLAEGTLHGVAADFCCCCYFALECFPLYDERQAACHR